jgi:hypothetical protein
VLRFSPVQDVVDGQSASFAHLNGLVNGDVAFSKIKQVASDAKEANRDIRVWHGATENGP